MGAYILGATRRNIIGLYTQTELENYADVLLWAVQESRGRKFRHGDVVVIRYDHPAIPLVEVLYSLCMDRHVQPVPVANPTPIMEVERYLNSSFSQLIFQQPGREELFKAASGCINILAPESLDHLQSVDPHTIADAHKAEAPFRRMLELRRQLGALGWTVCLYPTRVLADAAGMGLEEYATRLKRACWLNMPDPAREWRRIRKELAEWGARLDGLGIQSLHVEGEHLDLRVRLGANRRFMGVTGGNIPGCELYVAPDCRGVDGVFFANQPSIRQGNVVQGATLEFHGGVAVKVDAEYGLGFLQRQLYSDAGARRVGEFSLTDRRFSRVDRFMAHTLLDENVGGEHGNCHIALGGSLTECFDGPPEALTPELEAELGFNTSDIHWDLVNTEPKRVTALVGEGRPVLIYENGEFKF
ncbi:aminopeptidase [Salidesulfovibrio onnuriiensis]|uniref:aminopeptidase n=1 Tax=Salidesulfovibrio onnuriiensis TaxID=2583823 RepID=UPI0011CBEB22|nr:aminopeptidase [Salidesulfovibrio onnuriiensis]